MDMYMPNGARKAVDQLRVSSPQPQKLRQDEHFAYLESKVLASYVKERLKTCKHML
mgnify:CR=1 FL=1